MAQPTGPPTVPNVAPISVPVTSAAPIPAVAITASVATAAAAPPTAPPMTSATSSLDQQLAAKDQVIKELAKTPRSVHNTTINTTTNVFGDEKTEHMLPEVLKKWADNDHTTLLVKYIDHKYNNSPNDENKNIYWPNKKRPELKVLENEGWKLKHQDSVLPDLLTDNKDELIESLWVAYPEEESKWQRIDFYYQNQLKKKHENFNPEFTYLFCKRLRRYTRSLS